jgi:hypothetical protein
MKKMILMLGLVIGIASFAGEVIAQPPHAKAWGKRTNKNWNKGNGHWNNGNGHDAWEHRYWNKKHYKKVKVVRPAGWRERVYVRPARPGVVINARARF